jgi:hypothetical protein
VAEINNKSSPRHLGLLTQVESFSVFELVESQKIATRAGKNQFLHGSTTLRQTFPANHNRVFLC